MIDERARRTFGEQGYVVARSLFDVEETAFLRDHFTRLREAGAYPGDVVGVEPGSDDPLRKYPRMIHMHRLCTIDAATSQSFTDVKVPLPEGEELVPVLMEPGDVLFFNGSLVHGSKPNRSDRFRRALIGHYLQGHAREVAYWYHPVLRMDGIEVELKKGLGGGPCGEWVDRDGRAAIELTGVAVDPRTTD
jgi:ectoine hydroxylase-related dioxygenase (phytanoyl-CoA dioxygenase family)